MIPCSSKSSTTCWNLAGVNFTLKAALLSYLKDFVSRRSENMAFSRLVRYSGLWNTKLDTSGMFSYHSIVPIAWKNFRTEWSRVSLFTGKFRACLNSSQTLFFTLLKTIPLSMLFTSSRSKYGFSSASRLWNALYNSNQAAGITLPFWQARQSSSSRKLEMPTMVSDEITVIDSIVSTPRPSLL